MTEDRQNEIFTDWLEKYKAIIFKIIRAYAFTDMDREDLFQEITLQVWRSIPAFREEALPSTWIYRIALNVAIKWVRKERQRHRMTAPDDPDLQDGPNPPDALHILHENPSGLGGVPPREDERLAWLYAQIHELNEIDRSLALLMLDGFSYREMAVILGITESNVGVRINRIKKLLISRSKKMDRYGT